ncbi:DUF2244 domain-containing protein [Aurantimonas sp. MSK8Z-1]|uniref:DUF2244 domain-containing protein n=1 Tax=Mangrovibrevibacter kandeliae TaxID=2968473 RepID=UPI002118DB15|nr:DUF2244 domain-containing protein [Aurantimonas sp. MSK8Z-1]MCW4117064.1 DUF2244 domain-containing protein [Aurantimonas sp. MSK8Z-1]
MSDNAPPRDEPSALNASDEPLFRALLVPYRSLGRRGFSILMLGFGAVSLISGIAFLMRGAWPVFGFFGLDVLLVWLAFRASYRSARAREEVAVSRTDLSIRKISARGVVREAHYNPFWTRFLVRRHDEYGITHMAVRGEGRSTEIGAFLNPEDRESFAGEFNRALHTAKRG